MTTRIASLGMYDHPEQHGANDLIWAELARTLRALGVPHVPDSLDRSRPVEEIWRDPALLFGQICGYPLVRAPELKLKILALPCYAAPGCEADRHSSFIITRQTDAPGDLSAYRGKVAAINDRGSNSGMNLFRAAVAEIAGGGPFFENVRITGSHRDSILSVIAGDADIAAIDAVTYAAIARFEPELTASLRVIGQTPSSPTLPFVTGNLTDPKTVKALELALARILADPDLANARAALLLTGATPGTIQRFAALQQFETDATRAGYPVLR